MNISNFKPNGTPWSFQEDEQLNKLYNQEFNDINKISNIIIRTPGSIISRLCKHNYIPNRQSARGYNEYKNSDLYKSIVASGEGRKPKPNTSSNKNDNISINISGINNCEYLELKNDVKEIKNEINDLKNIVKKLVEMMESIYEFDDT
jgi:hypothetical protein